MHVIDEDTAERLDKIPAQYQVIVTHRSKYGCRACEGAIKQASAAERLIRAAFPRKTLSLTSSSTNMPGTNHYTGRHRSCGCRACRSIARHWLAGLAPPRPKSSRFICG
jgi:hypothetical protein